MAVKSKTPALPFSVEAGGDVLGRGERFVLGARGGLRAAISRNRKDFVSFVPFSSLSN